jgi:hypothetical protein
MFALDVLMAWGTKGCVSCGLRCLEHGYDADCVLDRHVVLQDGKQNAPFVPTDGDMKIQLSSTTMAWVDRQGNILHSWKRTKRGTRGGKNRRHEDHQSINTPRGTKASPTPRDSGKAGSDGPAPVAPETQGQSAKEDSNNQAGLTLKPAGSQQAGTRQDSDCSSTCELNDGPQAEVSHADSAQTPTAGASHSRQDSYVSGELVGDPDDVSADHLLMTDPSSTSPHEMAELITRLYGLVNVLQNDNEQVCCRESSLLSVACMLRNCSSAAATSSMCAVEEAMC